MRTSRDCILLAQMQYNLAFKAIKSSSEYKGQHLKDLKPITHTCLDLGIKGLSRMGWLKTNKKLIIIGEFEYYN